MKTRSTLASFAPVTVKWTIGHVSKQQLLGCMCFISQQLQYVQDMSFNMARTFCGTLNAERRLQNTKLLLKLVIRVRKLSESGSI